MDWNRDIVAEGEVVEEIDREEEGDIREPSNQGDSPGFEEEGRMGCRKVGGPSEGGRYEKLNEGDEKTWEEWFRSYRYGGGRVLPLLGSSLGNYNQRE